MKKNKNQNRKGFPMPDETTTSSASIQSNDISTSNTVSSSSVSSSVTAVETNAVTPTVQAKKATIPVKKEIPVKNVVPVKKYMNTQATNVDKLNLLISAFTNAVDKKQDSITQWINLCNFLNRTNDPKVFDAFRVWFARHRQTYADCTVALHGVHTIQNANTKTRVSATHQCFEELVRALSSRTAHYRFSMKAMQAMCIGVDLARWILRTCER